MANTAKRIAVMGVGWVGGAMARWFEEEGMNPILYDPPKGIGSREALDEADVIFVCLPTPYDETKGFDLSYVEEGVAAIGGKKTVVIRSTVLPGTTESLQRRFPQHRFLFNPEFLRQATADADFRAPDRQIAGVTDASAAFAEQALACLPKAPFTRVLRATEAETVKYFGNCFLALKVIFANQVFDLCAALGIDYDTVKACAAADPRIGASHLNVLGGGCRGYSGGCFPKDVKAFLQLADTLGVDLALLKTCEEINATLTGQRRKTTANTVTVRAEAAKRP
jgi:UDPglucose 6-dehydrogenase